MASSKISNFIRALSMNANSWPERYEIGHNPLNRQSDKSFLIVARHFNSETPITPGPLSTIPFNIARRPLQDFSNQHYNPKPTLIGGGYFIGHKGFGIAIDPGWGFVDSLHRYHQLTVADINWLFITHDHLDHHSDLENILILRREVIPPLRIFANEEVGHVYELEKRSHIPGSPLEFIQVKAGDEINIGTIGNIKILPSLHWQRPITTSGLSDPSEILKSHLNALGVYIKLAFKGSDPVNIIITGDTLFPVELSNAQCLASVNMLSDPYLIDDNAYKFGWKPGDIRDNNILRNKMETMLSDAYKNMVQTYKTLTPDITCLHIGSIEKQLQNISINFDDTKLPNLVNDPSYCYTGHHLGLLGALRLLHTINTHDNGLAILTEFGEELIGNRQNMSASLEELYYKSSGHSDKKLSVIPSELTLRVDLMSRAVQCSYCIESHPWNDITAIEGPGDIIEYVAKGVTNSEATNCALRGI
jgi:hypothetical protein